MDNSDLFGFTQPPHGQPRIRIAEDTLQRIKNRIREEWPSGLPVQSIADKLSAELELPISKNMVSGHVHRMRLEPRPDPIKRTSPRPKREWTPEKVRKQKFNPTPKGHRPKSWFEGAKPPTEAFKARKIVPSSHPIPTEHLRRHTCRWPEWNHEEKATHLYCGQRINPGYSYCAYHCGFAFSNLQPERIANVQDMRPDDGKHVERLSHGKTDGPVQPSDSVVRPEPNRLPVNEDAGGISGLTDGPETGNP